MGNFCCCNSKVVIGEEDEDLAKSIVLEVVNVKVNPGISTDDSAFQVVGPLGEISPDNSFSSYSV